MQQNEGILQFLSWDTSRPFFLWASINYCSCYRKWHSLNSVNYYSCAYKLYLEHIHNKWASTRSEESMVGLLRTHGVYTWNCKFRSSMQWARGWVLQRCWVDPWKVVYGCRNGVVLPTSKSLYMYVSCRPRQWHRLTRCCLKLASSILRSRFVSGAWWSEEILL